MRRYALIFLCLACVAGTLSAQQKKRPAPQPKKHPKFTELTFGVGRARSLLFISRNVSANNDARGYTYSLGYGGARMLKVVGEYTKYQNINIAPTWYTVRAYSAEVNLHILARFENMNAVFYPIVGFSYNHFSGFFTGKNDFMGLYLRYPLNSVVVTNWIGLNTGTGFEYRIKQLGFFGEYKMRVGIDKELHKQLNIMDGFFCGGLKYTIRVPSPYALKKIFRGTRNRYFLDAE